MKSSRRRPPETPKDHEYGGDNNGEDGKEPIGHDHQEVPAEASEQATERMRQYGENRPPVSYDRAPWRLTATRC
jgi:hypothetical protein